LPNHDNKNSDDFYPIVLATVPPTILTREEVDRYFNARNTTVSAFHLPATNPRAEDGK
jgi:hypothetical protein